MTSDVNQSGLLQDRPIPLLLCIDVEPDQRVLSFQNPSSWEGFERCHELFRSLRDKIRLNTGSSAHFSWFFRMDPQVAQVYGSATWPLTRYPKIVGEIQNQGDELGLHIHCSRWDQALNHWVNDHGDPSWVEYCLESSLGAFQEGFGKRCQSVRMGDRWMSDRAVALLEKFGVRFDLTLEPGHEGRSGLTRKEHYSGFIPDYRDLSRAPYLPLPSNFKKPDPERREGMWMIPLSTGKVSGIQALALKIFYRWVRGYRLNQVRMTLYPLLEPGMFQKMADHLLRSMDRPYLAMPLRSNVPLNSYFLRNIRKNFDYILSHPRVKDFVFSTPKEALAHLKIISAKESMAGSAQDD